MVLSDSAFEGFNYDMTLPFITNSQKIKADAELILEHGFREKKRAKGGGKGRSWVDDLGQRASKKQKAQTP